MNSNNNNKEISNVIRIQGTNDNSILSKCSMIKYGYFNDEFLPFMIGKFSRRAPLINRGYYIRAKAIEHILLTFIENNKHMDAIQIFSLGAGFDTSFFRLHKQGKLDNCTFIELDYFDVAQRKAVLMQQESKLWKCLSSPEHPVSLHKDNYIVINASNYKLIGIDMTKLDILDACIRASGVSYDLPTLFLSECVITYISTKKSASLLKFIAKSFSENCFVLYEQIYPDDSFGRFMCSHFKQLGSSLRGIQTYKTKEMQMERLLHAGWDSATSWDMAEFYYNIVSSEEKSRIEHLEVFDEYEEWLLKCNHYMVLVACRGSVCWRPGPILIDVPVTLAAAAAAAPVSPADPADPADTLRLPPLNLIQYHSANQQQQTEEPQFKFGGIKTHYVKADLIAGNGTGNRRQYLLRSSGYGQNPFSAGHCRLTCLSILDLTTNVMRHIEPARSQLLANSLCGSMTRISGNCFIIFGGRSSPLKPNDLATRLQLHYNADANAADGNAADGNAADGNAADANADNGGGGGGNLWQAECSPLIAVNEADKPSARWRHMAGCYWLHDKPYLLIYGGRSSDPNPLSDNYIFDFSLNSWQQLLGQQSPGPLCSGSVVSIGTDSFCSNDSPDRCCGCCCLLLTGGLSGSDLVPSGNIWRWCGRRQQWTEIASNRSFLPRFSHTSHIVYRSNHCNPTTVTMASVGGVSHKTPSCGVTLISIDLVANSARCIDMAVDTGSQSECVMIHNHGSAFSSDSKQIYIVGGGGNCFSFGTQLNENVYSIDLSNIDFYK